MCHPFDGRRSLIPIHQMLFQQTYRLFTFIYDQEKHCISQLAGGITLNKRRKQLLPLIGGMTWKCMECIGCFSIFWETETAFILIAKKTTNLMCLQDNMGWKSRWGAIFLTHGIHWHWEILYDSVASWITRSALGILLKAIQCRQTFFAWSQWPAPVLRSTMLVLKDIVQ